MTHSEDKETALDEARETPEMQQQELEEGTEMHSSVPLTEEFQMMAMDLIKDATKEQCAFIQSLLSSRQQEHWKDEEVTTSDYDKVKSGDEEESENE